jgi:CheY-like chemotaxis protein
LLAEDNLVAREATVKMLRRLGYQVIVARDGHEGLTAGTEFIKDIDLLITDVVMPGLSGPELARELHMLRADLRVLFISGYPGDSLSPFNIDEDEEFLRKPFNLKTLSSKLRQIFGGSLPPK